MYPLIVPGIC